jgi:hypothetical protein
MNSDYQIMQSKLLLQKGGGVSAAELPKPGITTRDQNASTLEPARHTGIKLPAITSRPSSQLRGTQGGSGSGPLPSIPVVGSGTSGPA